MSRADGLDAALVGEIDEGQPRQQAWQALWEYQEEPLRLIRPEGGGLRPPHPQLPGIAALGTWLRRAGFSVSAHDNVFTIPRSRAAFLEALDRRPRAVGISTTLIKNPESARKLAALARERCPEALLIMGGAGAARDPQMRALGDVTVLGPGERTLQLVLERLKDRKDWRDVENLCYPAGGGEARTPERSNLELAELPELDWGLIFPHASLCYTHRASMGCRYDCVFCSEPDRGRPRQRPVAVVVSELRQACERFGARFFRFVDAAFTADCGHALELCRAIAEARLPMEWGCYARVDNLAQRPELAKALRDAGCRWVFCGIESGCDAVLKAMRKGFDRGTALRGVAVAREAGLRVHGNFIVGFPGETTATVDETLELVERSRLDTACFFAFSPHEGSEMAGPAWQGGASMERGQALEETRRCVRAVWQRMEHTLPGNEHKMSNSLRGGGLSDEEALDYLRALRAFHRNQGRDEALSRLANYQDRLRAFWASRGWIGSA